MSTHRLIGVTDAAGAAEARKHAGLHIAEHGELAAILKPATKPLAAWLQTRKAEMSGLLEFQKLLEQLSSSIAILPAAYGSEFVSPADATALLAVHGAEISDSLASYGRLAQFQIEVRWEPAAAMARLKADGRLAGLDVALAGRDRKAFGEALQALMEAERLRMATGFAETLRDAAREVIRLPLADETTLLNAAALIAREDERKLDAAVERIDATMPDALKIRYIGPLPAVSFATITICTPDAARLSAARKRLGVDADALPNDVRARHRIAIKAAHPDTAGAIADADAAADLGKAYALALRAALAPRTAKGAPLLLDIRREGDGTARNAA